MIPIGDCTYSHLICSRKTKTRAKRVPRENPAIDNDEDPTDRPPSSCWMLAEKELYQRGNKGRRRLTRQASISS